MHVRRAKGAWSSHDREFVRGVVTELAFKLENLRLETELETRIEGGILALARQIEAKDRVLVGLNAFQAADEQKIPVFKGNPETERRQCDDLRALRARRDGALVERRLAELVSAARANENLVPVLVETVKAYATLGEICEALRGVYGVYQPSQVI